MESELKRNRWRALQRAHPRILYIYFLGGTIASLNALAGLILTTVLAGIWISCPVAGFRPLRAFLLTRTDLPMPGSTKAPFFLVSAIASAVYSSIRRLRPSSRFQIYQQNEQRFVPLSSTSSELPYSLLFKVKLFKQVSIYEKNVHKSRKIRYKRAHMLPGE